MIEQQAELWYVTGKWSITDKSAKKENSKSNIATLS